MTMSVPDANGWDTISAIRVDDANAEILRQKRYPATFQATAPDGSASISGTFGPWQIKDGDAEVVNLALPITSATITKSGVDTTVSGNAPVTVQLVFVHTEDDPAPGSKGTGTDGTMATSAAKSTAGATSTAGVNGTGNHDLRVKSDVPGAATLGDMAYDEDPDFDTQLDFDACFQAWLDTGLHAFDHVFATVDIGREVAVDGFQWLQPHETGYAYVTRAPKDVDLIGVLATTGTRSSANLPRQLSPSIIPDGSRGGLLISPARFLDEVVRLSLVNGFQGTRPDDFELSTDGVQLSLKAAVNLAERVDTVQNDPGGGTGTYKHRPVLETLTVRFEESRLIVDATTQSTISPWIYSNARRRSVYEIQLATLVGGGQTMQFVLDPTADEINTHWTSRDSAYTYLQWAEIAAGLIALIVLTVLTDGVALFLAGMGLALLQGLAQVLPSILELEGTADAPSVDVLLVDACGAIKWPGASGFSLTFTDLSGGLRLGGDPGFASAPS
jgi:hypothetical protein